MQSTKLKSIMAIALSSAMLFATAACGTSDKADAGTDSAKGSDAATITSYDVSSVEKDDTIAALLQAVRQAFEHNVLILGFNQTVHNRLYIAPEHLFESSEVSALVETIKLALSDVVQMRQALGKQGQHANYVDLVRYQETMQTVLGG